MNWKVGSVNFVNNPSPRDNNHYEYLLRMDLFGILGKTSIKVILRKHKNAMNKEQRRHQALQVF